MNHDLSLDPAIGRRLTVDDPITLRLRAGTAIFVVRGEAWITQEGTPHDMILRAGDRFNVPARAPLVISATRDRVDVYVVRPAAARLSASCNVHDFMRAQAAHLRRVGDRAYRRRAGARRALAAGAGPGSARGTAPRAYALIRIRPAGQRRLRPPWSDVRRTPVTCRTNRPIVAAPFQGRREGAWQRVHVQRPGAPPRPRRCRASAPSRGRRRAGRHAQGRVDLPRRPLAPKLARRRPALPRPHHPSPGARPARRAHAARRREDRAPRARPSFAPPTSAGRGRKRSSRPRSPKKADGSGRSVDHTFWLTPGHASEPGVWYAGTSPQGLFRSDDGGVTWASASPINDDPQYIEWMGTRAGWHARRAEDALDHRRPARSEAPVLRHVERRRARVHRRRPDASTC